MPESVDPASVVLPVLDAGDADSIDAAAAVLRGGGLVAFPTETVYGLGADIGRPDALRRIFEVKGRPANDPLIVHVATLDEARTLTSSWPDAAQRLAERCWPGPLTMVLPRSGLVDDVITAGGSTVGVRLPAHPVARALIMAAGSSIAAPSANRFGRISPTTAAHVLDEFGPAEPGSTPGSVPRPDLIVDGGACPLGVESTVVDLSGGVPTVLRPGGVGVEELRELLGDVEVVDRHVASDDAAVASPGEFLAHYSPGTPLVLVEGDGAAADGLAAALRSAGVDAALVGLPTEGGAAAALVYERLRVADAAGHAVLVGHLVAPDGLGRAVNDRLFRAAHGRVVSADVDDRPAVVERVRALLAP